MINVDDLMLQHFNHEEGFQRSTDGYMYLINDVFFFDGRLMIRWENDHLRFPENMGSFTYVGWGKHT